MVVVHLEWGPRAVDTFGDWADVVVVVDVLSFSTAVEVAVSRGAAVVPCVNDRAVAEQLGRDLRALVAVPRKETNDATPFSLSPASLASLPAGRTLVLRSPNGSAITAALASSGLPIVAGCLRNASAVGAYVGGSGARIGVVAAGERWPSDGSLRPAYEDLIGAGAVVAAVREARQSPEAEAAAAAFADAAPDLSARLRESVSGRELRQAGYESDVAWAAELDAAGTVPLLVDGRYVDAAAP